MRKTLVALIILSQPNQIVHEIFQLILAVLVLSLQSESAVFASKVLQAKLGVCLRKVKQSQCIAILHLLMIDSSLIKKAEYAAFSLE